MSMEAGVVVGLDGKAAYWHLPAERTGGSLPDSHELWDFIWNNRTKISGIAHSHPGRGVPGPSYTDVTTFAAIEDALGKRLQWWITSEDNLVVCAWGGPGKHTYPAKKLNHIPSWLKPLREASQALSEHKLTEVCLDAMYEDTEAVKSLKVGKEAMDGLVQKVLSRIPHAEPGAVMEKIGDLLPDKS